MKLDHVVSVFIFVQQFVLKLLQDSVAREQEQRVITLPRFGFIELV